MKYYTLETSLNKQIMGNLPQVKEIIHDCNVQEESEFIDDFPFQKINFEPNLSSAVLNKRSNLTDLIDVGGIGFSYGSILMSNRLKKIIAKFKTCGIDFYETQVFQGDKRHLGFWQTHVYKVPYDAVNFLKTKIELTDRDRNRNLLKEELSISSKSEFLNIAKFISYPKMIKMKDVKFNSNLELDFFFLRYFETKNIVSDKLKNEIEKNNITGIEFKPLE